MIQSVGQSISQGATVLLTGASAQVGLHAMPKLLGAGFEVCALSRTIRQSEVKVCSAVSGLRWFSPDNFKAIAPGENSGENSGSPFPEILISAGPIHLAVQMLEQCSSIKKLVCLSTTSVFSKADSSDQGEKELIETIIQAEQQLMALCTARKVDLAILRPTLIYGCGMDENISRLGQFIRRFGFLPLAGPATGLRQPLHVYDLAELITIMARSEMPGCTEYVVTGGSTLSYRDMAAKIFKALGKTERMLSLPPGLLATSVSVAGRIAAKKSLTAAMVLRQNQDLVFDGSKAQQQFGFKPRTFEPTAGDFQLPDELLQYLPA
jgi:nucleoside-diphosphate-sugar epimerase